MKIPIFIFLHLFQFIHASVRMLALIQNVVLSTVSGLRQHPRMRSAMDALLFTGSELIMAFTCVGGPVLLGGT